MVGQGGVKEEIELTNQRVKETVVQLVFFLKLIVLHWQLVQNTRKTSSHIS